MTYDLAKALKDAGFRQVWPTGRGEMYVGEYESKGVREGVYIPTLSELIEECGDVFCGVSKNISSESWTAETFHLPTQFGPKVKHTSGSTPEEAVARLWLALNSNN